MKNESSLLLLYLMFFDYYARMIMMNFTANFYYFV